MELGHVPPLGHASLAEEKSDTRTVNENFRGSHQLVGQLAQFTVINDSGQYSVILHLTPK